MAIEMMVPVMGPIELAFVDRMNIKLSSFFFHLLSFDQTHQTLTCALKVYN